MSKQLRIDIVSDVVCPWCIIGYKRLENALNKFKDTVDFDIHWQPFELNPHMSEDGENLREHLSKKYGTTLEGSIQARANLTAMGKDLGFSFNYFDEMRMFNTFLAHQLLHWAGETSDKQTELKLALFGAYFTDGRDVSDASVLIDVVTKVGLDPLQAKAIMAEQRYANVVREIQGKWVSAGISGVPAVIFDERNLVSGAQESAAFEDIITRLTSKDTV